MMYLLSVGANLILKHFAIKRVNEKIKDDSRKLISNDVILNILAYRDFIKQEKTKEVTNE